MLSFTRISEHRHEVHFHNGARVGTVEREVDGFFYFWPEDRAGFWAEHLLRGIADKLAELNKPWAETITRELST